MMPEQTRSRMAHRAVILSLGATMLMAACTRPTSNNPSPDRPKSIAAFMGLDGRPRVIAHRGFSEVAPENTRAAFRRAADAGADMFELDVLLTADGEVVCIHDDTVDRTTGREGPIASFTLEEVRAMDAGSWFAPEFAGEPIPTLAEVLDFTRGRILLIVEIKSEAVTDTAKGGIVDKVLQLIAERDMQHEVMIQSFSPRAMRQVRELGSTIQTAMLYNKDRQEGMTPAEIMADTGANGFNLSHEQVTAEIIEQCHRLGRPVAVYTVDEPERMREMIELGADALITNRPDLAMGIVRE